MKFKIFDFYIKPNNERILLFRVKELKNNDLLILYPNVKKYLPGPKRFHELFTTTEDRYIPQNSSHISIHLDPKSRNTQLPTITIKKTLDKKNKVSRMQKTYGITLQNLFVPVEIRFVGKNEICNRKPIKYEPYLLPINFDLSKDTFV